MEAEEELKKIIRGLNKTFELGTIECRRSLWTLDRGQRLRAAHEEILAIFRRIDDLPYDDSLKDDVKAELAKFFNYPLKLEDEE